MRSEWKLSGLATMVVIAACAQSGTEPSSGRLQASVGPNGCPYNSVISTIQNECSVGGITLVKKNEKIRMDRANTRSAGLVCTSCHSNQTTWSTKANAVNDWFRYMQQ